MLAAQHNASAFFANFTPLHLQPGRAVPGSPVPVGAEAPVPSTAVYRY